MKEIPLSAAQSLVDTGLFRFNEDKSAVIYGGGQGSIARNDFGTWCGPECEESKDGTVKNSRPIEGAAKAEVPEHSGDPLE